MRRPGPAAFMVPMALPEAIWFELRGLGEIAEHGVVSLFGFGGWDVADGLQQSPVVEPVHPFQLCELDGFKGSPWPAPMDYLCFVKAIDRLY